MASCHAASLPAIPPPITETTGMSSLHEVSGTCLLARHQLRLTVYRAHNPAARSMSSHRRRSVPPIWEFDDVPLQLKQTDTPGDGDYVQ